MGMVMACALSALLAQDPVPSDAVVELSPRVKGGRGLGTGPYGPTSKEGAFLKKVTEKPVSFGSDVQLPKPANLSDEEWAKFLGELKQGKEKRKETTIPDDQYQLADQAGQVVGWFGIVRASATDEKTGALTLTIEHKYFDGMVDLHQQIVSITGAGDFTAALGKCKTAIPPLSLIRVYGKAAKEKDGSATVSVEYARVWDWGLFAFMAYGKDKSNAKWVSLRKPEGDEEYSARPTTAYYESLLGKRP